MGNSIKTTLKFLDMNEFSPSGWFDPRCGILYIKEFPQDNDIDPNSLTGKWMARKGEDLRQAEVFRKSQQNFFESFPEWMKREWKNAAGVSQDYQYNPDREFQFEIPYGVDLLNVFQKVENDVMLHEYCHYIQYIRSMASPVLLWALLNLIIKAEILFMHIKEKGITLLEYPVISSTYRDKFLKIILNDLGVFDTLNWHYGKKDGLCASSFKEAEAQFNTILAGKHFLRFKAWESSEHPVTLYFRELYNTKPLYSKAYLEVEEALGRYAPVFFPLITYFALSMPVKKQSIFSKVEIDPVHPVDAFRAVLKYLKKDISRGYPYASYAEKLYTQPPKASLNELMVFCRSVCKENGWASPVDFREHWIKILDKSGWDILMTYSRIFEYVFQIERNYGSEFLSEAMTKAAEPALSQIPLPLIIFPEKERLLSIGDKNVWNDGCKKSMIDFIAKVGMALSIFIDPNIENNCPHKECRFREVNFCSGIMTYPQSHENCEFQAYFEKWSGLSISKFVKRQER